MKKMIYMILTIYGFLLADVPCVPLLNGDYFTITGLQPGHTWYGTLFTIKNGKTCPFINRAAAHAHGVQENRIRTIDIDLFQNIKQAYPLGEFITADIESNKIDAVANPQNYKNLTWAQIPQGFKTYAELDVPALQDDKELALLSGMGEILQLVAEDVKDVGILKRVFLVEVQTETNRDDFIVLYDFDEIWNPIESLLLAEDFLKIDQSTFLATDSVLTAHVLSPENFLLGTRESITYWNEQTKNRILLGRHDKIKPVCELLEQSTQPVKAMICFDQSAIATQGAAIAAGSMLSGLAGLGGVGGMLEQIGPAAAVAFTQGRHSQTLTSTDLIAAMESEKSAQYSAGLVNMFRGLGKLAASFDPDSESSQQLRAEVDQIQAEVYGNVAVFRMQIPFEQY